MRVPRPLSSFVGRVGTLADLAVLLRERQLITLTGPGGIVVETGYRAERRRIGISQARADLRIDDRDRR